MPLSPSTPAWQQEYRPEEVIQALENEVSELKSLLQTKDQKIADLTRVTTASARLRKDIRQLVGELHSTRQQLTRSRSEVQELRDKISLLGVVAPSPGGFANRRRGNDPNDLIADLQEQNRQLLEAAAESRSKNSESSKSNAGYSAGGTMVQGPSSYAQGVPSPEDRQVEPIMYTSEHQEHAGKIGPTMLEGYGLVNGVYEIAQIVLQRAPHSFTNMMNQQAQLNQQQQMEAYRQAQGHQLTPQHPQQAMQYHVPVHLVSHVMRGP